MALIKGMLEVLGLQPERVRISWMSASEGPQFAERAREIDETVRELGPNPLSGKATI